MIAAVGNLGRPTHRLLDPRPQRAGQLVDLGSCVVDVELAGHPVAGPVEQRCNRIPQGRPPAVAHVQRARGIGGDELDVDVRAASCVAAAEPLAQGVNGRQHGGELILGEEEIDEAGTRDLDLLDDALGKREGPHQVLRDGAWRLTQPLGNDQRQVGGAVAVRGIARGFVLELRKRRHADLVGRVPQTADDLVVRLHLSPESFFFLALSPDFDSAGFDSAAGLDSSFCFCSCCPCFSPARL